MTITLLLTLLFSSTRRCRGAHGKHDDTCSFHTSSLLDGLLLIFAAVKKLLWCHIISNKLCCQNCVECSLVREQRNLIGGRNMEMRKSEAMCRARRQKQWHGSTLGVILLSILMNFSLLILFSLRNNIKNSAPFLPANRLSPSSRRPFSASATKKTPSYNNNNMMFSSSFFFRP